MKKKQMFIDINKLIGETGQLRDEATLEHIVERSSNEAKDIAQLHPFVDGNKRTAYIVYKLIHNYGDLYTYICTNYKSNDDNIIDIFKHIKERSKVWLDILEEC